LGTRTGKALFSGSRYWMSKGTSGCGISRPPSRGWNGVGEVAADAVVGLDRGESAQGGVGADEGVVQEGDVEPAFDVLDSHRLSSPPCGGDWGGGYIEDGVLESRAER
jgi:hypothetical protein